MERPHVQTPDSGSSASFVVTQDSEHAVDTMSLKQTLLHIVTAIEVLDDQ
jgi:hypothetical protein